jgi:hypothetical protein
MTASAVDETEGIRDILGRQRIIVCARGCVACDTHGTFPRRLHASPTSCCMMPVAASNFACSTGRTDRVSVSAKCPTRVAFTGSAT